MASMKLRINTLVAIVPLGFLLLGMSAFAPAQTPPQNSTQGKPIMTQSASGTFEAKLGPLESYNKNDGANLGRMSIDKQFRGDLEATSKGEMLTAGSAAKGSAGYVAIERVTGALQGKSGSFVLQHSGTMNRGAPQLAVTVVPDSGTAQLAGIAGKMTITIAEGKHSYELQYTLAETP